MSARRLGQGGRRPRQQGQALTEFVVIALALVPLFLLLPMIAKYQDIAHATQLASRYVAFDAITRNDAAGSWKPASQLSAEVSRRYFSNSSAPVKSGDTAGDFKAHQNAFWRDQQGKALIRSFERDVSVSFGTGHSAIHEHGFSDASDGLPFGLVRDWLGLKAQGVYAANVTVSLADLPSDAGSYTKTYETFSKIGLKVTRHTALAINPWSAKDPAQIDTRLDQPLIFPGSVLAPVKPLVDAAVVIVESPSCFKGGCTRGPELGKLDFWRDVVPADRLKK